MARLTRKELDRWVELEEQRLSLARQTKDIVALQQDIEAKCLDYVRTNGGPERVCMCCDFRLEIKLQKNGVQWKPEFIRIAGMEAAEALVAGAGTKEVLKIEPPPS